ncbi:ATP-dependent DNA helicase [Streptomyces sp. WAC07149]|uniref:HelD family protein n=1 Tax=Streptomyces sp. WAC07149 TaxID=2487425 RepID=UPI000F7A75A2|nr:AAA family ATPase [Streptomyces sp. WAC07149]RST04419.1 ATP-dependent DNA helicase [Streptomyces sp. WAC07149]
MSSLYEVLTERLSEARENRASVLKAPADNAGEAYEREIAAERLAKEIGRLEGAENGLVFGRIDRTDGTTLRIGRIGLHTEEDDLPLLVDWRAHAARPFYEATPVHPMALRRRRHLRLEERTVVSVSDELLDGTAPTGQDVVGDGPLTEALSARRTGRMHAAVATLQAEQDEIVRSAHRGVTVVQGGPGTGKTVVALHRAAYVLYAFPRAAEEGVLVVGPNSRFLDYISQVLPSLGENDVVLATCRELAGVAADTAADPFETARLKGGSDLADALAGLLRAHQAPAGEFSVRVGRQLVHLSGEEVAAARDAALAAVPGHNPARQVFTEFLVDAVADAMRRDMGDLLEQIDADSALMTGMDLDRFTGADRRRAEGAAEPGPAHELDLDAVRADLLDDAGVDRAVEALWPRLVPGDLVQALLTDPDALAEHLPRLTAHERSLLLRGPAAPWTDADVPLLDEAASLVDGPPERTYGHVVVDEAQELTAMQWRMIVRRCPARAMTLVGDFAQAGPVATARDWKEALGPHVGPRFRLHHLTVSYRTTQEILESVRDLLTRIAPDQRHTRSLRSGESPRTLATPSDGLVTTVLQEIRTQSTVHPGELLGVVCADTRVGELTARGIGDHARIVPASEARGLEFDGVVVVHPEEITAARPGGERDLYVALTRATKRLCTVTVQQPAATGATAPTR